MKPNDFEIPVTQAALNDPAFHAYLQVLWPQGIIEPDEADFDFGAPAPEAEMAHQYRMAQARKLVRLYRGWKAEQS